MLTSVRDFGAKGDGKTDDTEAIQHAIEKSNGVLLFPAGDYRITRPLNLKLDTIGRLSLSGTGGLAKILMTAAGPAFFVQGTHLKSAKPSDFAPLYWQKERYPTLRDLEIEGRHAAADGVRVEGTMQATLQGLLIRHCRHAIRLTQRNRNVLISDCHIYDNTGIGIFLEGLNLHQININGNHISYCKQGGIRIEKSEIRNIQICSNDIEYNYDLEAKASADILIDCREGTVREGTIVGNTIQAIPSPGGACVRLVGGGGNADAVGLLAITGNLIGSQETLLDFQACRGVTVTGNCIYSGAKKAIHLRNSEHIVIGSNSIDHNPQYKGPSTDQVVMERSRNITVTGVILQHTKPAEMPPEASVEIRECENVQFANCQILQARTRGMLISQCKVMRVSGCIVRGGDDYKEAIKVDDASRQVVVQDCFLAKGSDGILQLPKESGQGTGIVEI